MSVIVWYMQACLHLELKTQFRFCPVRFSLSLVFFIDCYTPRQTLTPILAIRAGGQCLPFMGAQNLTGDNLKAVLAMFST